MNTQPAVLLYNFNNPDRLRIIRRYLNRQKVKVRIVTTPEFLHPLGYLFELPGFQPCAQFNLGKNFSEEMMVLNIFPVNRWMRSWRFSGKKRFLRFR